MAQPPSKNESRRLWVGVALLSACATSVALGRGVQRPWMPEAPAYRQKGPADAKVVLAEFSDFQCPSCGAAVGPMRHLESLHAGQMRLVFKHCPWARIHPWAMTAAIAAECAGKQGKFWEMFDKLYDNQQAWSLTEKAPEIINGYADGIKVDKAAFLKCIAPGGEGETLVKADMKDVGDHFINSTPTFFINGKRIVGIRQLSREGMQEIDRIPREMKKYIGLIGRIVVGVAFIASGYAKATGPVQEFAAVIEGYYILPDNWLIPAATVLPWAELILGVFLLTGYLTRLSAALLSGLLATFIAAIAWTKYAGIPLENCGCFNGIHFTPMQTLMMDPVLLALAIAAFMYGAQQSSLDNWIADGTQPIKRKA